MKPEPSDTQGRSAQGVSVKAHFSRGGQQFIFPVLLSRQLDLRVLAAAYLVPPILTLVGKYYVYKPLQRRYRLKKVCSEPAHDYVTCS